jgi:PAS domain S-box-containing protein
MSATQVISAGAGPDAVPPAEAAAGSLPAEAFIRLMRASRADLGRVVPEVLALVGDVAGVESASIHLALPGSATRLADTNHDVPAHCWPQIAGGDVVRVAHGHGASTSLVPVRVDDEIIGVLRLDSDRPAPYWTAQTVSDLRGVAAVIGTDLVRHAIQDELEESRRRYESVLNDVGAVIVRLDAQGRVSYVNRAWTELTGIPADEMIGKDALHHVHPDDRATAARHMADALSDDGTVREVRFLARDGRERWMEVKGRALFGEDGSINGFAGTMHDVTERRRDALNAQSARDRAEHARADAERVSQAKSEFLSRMSHELRTPLNAILGFGQLLELSDLNAEDADNLSQIMRAGRHLLHLINDSLDVSRIETGALTLSLEAVQIGPLVSESVDLLRPTADKLKLKLVLPGADGGRRSVSADRQRLKQVLVNLVSNAVKYNRPGGRVSIDCYPVAAAEAASGPDSQPGAEHGWIRIAVNDTGMGIPAERMDDIFVPFERVGAELTEIEGTGLGLALTRSLVEAMGGRITVSSVQGIGATFYVDLPAVSAADAWVEPTQDTGDGDGDEAPPQHTVVYIEDNPSNVMLVRRILARRPQVRLLVAGDGAAGLRMVREHRPDLVLLDLHLPQMVGAEVLDVIRTDKDPALRLTPIVVVTADLSPGTEERIMQAGANGFIGKPIDLPMLLDAIDRHVADVPAVKP